MSSDELRAQVGEVMELIGSEFVSARKIVASIETWIADGERFKQELLASMRSVIRWQELVTARVKEYSDEHNEPFDPSDWWKDGPQDDGE